MSRALKMRLYRGPFHLYDVTLKPFHNQSVKHRACTLHDIVVNFVDCWGITVCELLMIVSLPVDGEFHNEVMSVKRRR